VLLHASVAVVCPDEEAGVQKGVCDLMPESTLLEDGSGILLLLDMSEYWQEALG
jgi:hypothetical protein